MTAGLVVSQSQSTSLLQSLRCALFLAHVLRNGADVRWRVSDQLIALSIRELAAAQSINGIEVLALLILLVLLEQRLGLLSAVQHELHAGGIHEVRAP